MFVWSKEADMAFESLKKAFTSRSKHVGPESRSQVLDFSVVSKTFDSNDYSINKMFMSFDNTSVEELT